MMAAARRLIMARTTRRVNARPVNICPGPVHALKKRPPPVLEPRGLEVGVEGLRRPVVDRDVMPLPALLVEPEPPAAPLLEVVLPPHPQNRASPARSP